MRLNEPIGRVTRASLEPPPDTHQHFVAPFAGGKLEAHHETLKAIGHGPWNVPSATEMDETGSRSRPI